MLERIYVALDFPAKEEALNLLNQLPKGIGVKIGLELYMKEGISFVREIKEKGYNVFLDLKFHDIPQTVRGAVSQVAQFCDILNVHASGGLEMLKAAKEASLKPNNPPKLIGVSVLTSLSEGDWISIGGKGSIEEAAKKRAILCKEAGLDGVVTSTFEVPVIKEACGTDFLTVVPGIRLSSDEVLDQKRVATPKKAIELGSDYLVIGRPITRAVDPSKALDEILREID